MSSFIVQSNNRKTYSVQLFPKEKCNCPSTATCWHIIASKLSVGMHNIIPVKHTINLSQLKRNSRTKLDKKSGRKRPRPNDTEVEIIPAPDSVENLKRSLTHSVEEIKKSRLTDNCKSNDLVCFERIDVIDHENDSSTENILGKQWLTSDHMNIVNKLMLEASFAVNGFQETTLAPVLRKDGTWHIPENGFEAKQAPSVNIHYNSEKHWVTSFQFENGDIYLLDSNLGMKPEACLNDSLKVQLAQIYGQGKSKITVKIPHVQQQNNGYDCGLFAIANMMEFVSNRYDGLRDGKLVFTFIQHEMRRHLKKCLSQKFMEPFPKRKLKCSKQIAVKSVEIDLLCCCSSPHVKGLGPWIACSVCDQWYLQKCEGIFQRKGQKQQWYICKICGIDTQD